MAIGITKIIIYNTHRLVIIAFESRIPYRKYPLCAGTNWSCAMLN